MIDGTALWDTERFSDMACVPIGPRMVYTYQELELLPSLYHALVASCVKFPEKDALIDDYGRSYTYRWLLDMVDSFAGFLSAVHSIGCGSRVAVLFSSSIEYVVSLLALNRLGVVAVLLPNKYKAAELVPLVIRSEVVLILCEQVFKDWFIETGIPIITAGKNGSGYGFTGMVHTGNISAPELKPESNALIMFTSGTTAQNKVVQLKNYQIMHAIISYQRILNISSEDRSLIPIPIYTVTGTIAILGVSLYSGGTVVLHKIFDACRVLRSIMEHRISFLHASPTVFSLLLDHRESYVDLSSLRVFACGSSNMPVENIRRLFKWLPRTVFHTVYGLTETSSPATVFPIGAAESPFIGSSGIPIPGVAVKILNEDEKELAAGEVGEVALRGSVVIERYLAGGEDSFTGDGWFKTGDLGYVNEDGYLYIVDRKKDVINRGGEKICSFDVENAIHSVPGVLEAAVVGIPNPLYGEQPVAVVRVQKGYTVTEQQIKDALSAKIARFMIPVQFRFTDKLLKTPNGKIDKKGLQLWFQEVQK